MGRVRVTSLITLDYVPSSVTSSGEKPLLLAVTKAILNWSQYVNTVMQLLRKEISQKKKHWPNGERLSYWRVKG